MDKTFESLVKLNIESNERIALKMQNVIDRLTDVYDKHLTQLEDNRNLALKECLQLRDHCDKLTEMMARCQKMQSKILDALSDVTKKVGSGTNISIGDDNNI